MNIQHLINEVRDRAICAINGEVNELEVFAELHQLEEAVKEAKDSVKESALFTLDNRYGGKAELDGFEFSKTQSGRYNYSHIQDWNIASTQLKTIEKQAQEAYKMALKGVVLYDAEGVQIESAEYKENQESIKLIKTKNYERANGF